MRKTKNDLSKETRAKIVDLLNGRLADMVDLQMQMKQAHWTVRGMSFIGLHRLFDEIYEAAEEYVDLIAERAAQLGGVALGTVRVAAKASSLKEYPLNIADGAQHVEAVSDRLAAAGKLVREAIDQADELEDQDTADMFTEISRGIDQWEWFVEAHQV